MTVAEYQDVCSDFLERVRVASQRILLLDYDGTLAPFTPDRARAVPYPQIPELIEKIMAGGTRVALISGRGATELLALCNVHPHPEIWGSHGIERLRPDDSYDVETPPAGQRQALATAETFLRAAGLGHQIEAKPGSIAVHWRGLPAEAGSAIESKVQSACQPLIRDEGLELLWFDGGLELRAPGRNKGDAVAAILSESGPEAAAAYLGDDQTDEDAFRAIKGKGLGILVRAETRPTMADVWLRPPDELGRFLRDWLLACGAEG